MNAPAPITAAAKCRAIIEARQGSIPYGRLVTVSNGVTYCLGRSGYFAAWVACNESRAAARMRGATPYRWPDIADHSGAQKNSRAVHKQVRAFILAQLREHGTRTTPQLVAACDFQKDLSSALAYLRGARLIKSKRIGQCGVAIWRLTEKGAMPDVVEGWK